MGTVDNHCQLLWLRNLAKYHGYFGLYATKSPRNFGLIVLPLLIRALTGESLETLHSEIGPHVSQRLAFFFAACRNGGLA